MLESRMQTAIARTSPLASIVYRTVQIEYANKRDLISGLGTKQFGGRWTPPGLFATFHASLDANVALMESLSTQKHYGIAATGVLPLVLVAIDLKLQEILNLTDEDRLAELNLTRQKLIRCRWRQNMEKGHEALTQAVGRIAYEAGLEGLIVPSAQVRGQKNLIVFPDNLKKGSSLVIQNVEKLPLPSDD